MIPCEIFASIFPYLISEGRRNISYSIENMTLSKYDAEYEYMQKCMVEFSASFGVAALK